MKSIRSRGVRRSALICCASVGIASGLAAAAEPPEETLEELVITGTQIRGTAPVGTPLTVISPEEIHESGLANTVEVLRVLPQVANIGADEQRIGTSAGDALGNLYRSSGINLRGLGTDATLILVDGHRTAPAGILSNFFDPASIPALALSSLEVVADGASAIYGSDAISGVVNMVLKKNFDGAQLTWRYGEADSYNTLRWGGVAGKTWSSGAVMVAAETNTHSSLLAASRPDLFVNVTTPVSVQNSSAAPALGLVNFTPNANIRVGSTYYAVPYGAAPSAALTANTQWVAPFYYRNSVISGQDRNSAVMTFHQDISARLKLYSQAFYTNRTYNQTVPGSNLTLTLPRANPNFIPGPVGTAATETVLVTTNTTIGPTVMRGGESAYQGVLGLTAQLGSEWEIDGNYARNRTISGMRSPVINTCALQGGTGCVAQSGYLPGGAIAQTNPALAFNPFGANSATVIANLMTDNTTRITYDLNVAAVKADGPVFHLPGGAVKVAVGAERATHQYDFVQLRGANALTFGSQVANNHTVDMHVDSVFGEAVIPIVGASNARPALRKLDLSLAYRYDKYSLQSSGTTNPKVGFTWKPIEDLSIRGSYGTSYHYSLAAADLLNANSISQFTNLIDYTKGPGGTSVILQVNSGDPNIKPETATTYTLGFDFRPTALPGFVTNVTYFNIDYNDIISHPGEALVAGITSATQESIYKPFLVRKPTDPTALAAYLAQVADFLSWPTYTATPRLTPSQVDAYIDGRYKNAGELKTAGLDIATAYQLGSKWGDWNFGLSGTYYFNFDRSLTAADALTSRLDLVDFPTRYRARGQLGWHRSGIAANAFVNYIPGYSNTYVTPAAPVASYTTVDVALSYDFAERFGSPALHGWVIALNVQNLLQPSAPYAAISRQTFDSSVVSLIGRTTSLEIRKSF